MFFELTQVVVEILQNLYFYFKRAKNIIEAVFSNILKVI